MTPAPGVSAIVLAGGRSSRFGRDKLAEPIEGRPLLELAIRRIAVVAADVVVVGRPSAPEPPGGPPAMSLRAVPDPVAFEGPLAGLAAGLEVVREPLTLVAGGDMPSLDPAVLRHLVAVLAARADGLGACLVLRGRRQPLPLALRVGAATPAVARLVAAGERRLGALLDAGPVVPIEEVEWRPLDPEARTLRDVDRPEDLPD